MVNNKQKVEAACWFTSSSADVQKLMGEAVGEQAVLARDEVKGALPEDLAVPNAGRGDENLAVGVKVAREEVKGTSPEDLAVPNAGGGEASLVDGVKVVREEVK